MGRRGPKAKLPAQRKAEGNPSRRPIDAPTSSAWPLGAPARPTWLKDPIAIDTWDELLPLIAKAGILSPLDRNALAMYCNAVARVIAAETFLTEEGTVVTIRNDKGEVKQQAPAPEVFIALKYLEKANQLGERFGLTPVARQTIKTEQSKESALDAFLKAATK